MVIFAFWFKFYWSFVPKGPIGDMAAMVQVTAASHYQNQWWPCLLTHICVTWPVIWYLYTLCLLWHQSTTNPQPTTFWFFIWRWWLCVKNSIADSLYNVVWHNTGYTGYLLWVFWKKLLHNIFSSLHICCLYYDLRQLMHYAGVKMPQGRPPVNLNPKIS